MRAALPCLVSLALVAPALAGEQQAPVFSSGTDLVNVTVTITDDAGRLVLDLKQDDFELLEDGRPQGIQVFGSPSDPDGDGQLDKSVREALSINFGMLFDTSESMLDDLRLSQQAAVRFLDGIPRARQLVTVFFGKDIRISRYDTEDQQGLFERIQDTEGSGETPLYDAVAAFLSRLPDEGGRHALLLFTDGDDTSSSLSRGQSLDLLRATPVTVYAIAFYPDSPGSPRTQHAHAYLGEAAKITGGRVFKPRSYRDLPGIYDQILEELGGQYVLGFATDQPQDTERLRKLKVTVKRPGLKIRHRAAYRLRKD
jgi:VWFA-related protein